ncbi:MAG TPA: hypothetical protein ENJ01_10055 [Gammaproteobacteria bacterium]|nr:hypothetical protein [Gammaproteobacteria bacterium]
MVTGFITRKPTAMHAGLLRIIAAILAVLTTAWIATLLYSVSTLGPQAAGTGFTIRILFLVLTVLFAAYIAIKGRLPFSPRDGGGGDPDDRD